MRSPDYFIVKPKTGKRYNNTKSIAGLDLIVSTSEEDHKFSNREAEVISTPINYNGPVQPGDTLIVHHNAFKYYNDIKGNQRSGKSFFKDDLFFIELDQFFMYKHDDTWIAHDRYCFVEPIPPTESHIFKPMKEEPLIGIMRYPNQTLLDHNVEVNDMVTFRPDSEYEFEIDGKKMYRMFDHQITMVL